MGQVDVGIECMAEKLIYDRPKLQLANRAGPGFRSPVWTNQSQRGVFMEWAERNLDWARPVLACAWALCSSRWVRLGLFYLACLINAPSLGLVGKSPKPGGT